MVIIQELTLREDNKYIQIDKKDFSLALGELLEGCPRMAISPNLGVRLRD